MRYEAMGRNRTERLNVPQLLGGLNTATEPSLIADDELADVCNLTTDHGALVTRGAVRAIGDTPMWISEAKQHLNTKQIMRNLITFDKELCAVVLSSAHTETGEKATVAVQVVSLDGVIKKTYAMTSVGGGDFAFVVVPSDQGLHGAPFLVYHNNRVYRPEDDTETMILVGDDKLYAPLVMINAETVSVTDSAPPSADYANGVMYEGFNALTDRYRATFTPTVSGAIAECYSLPTAINANNTVVFDAVTASGDVYAELTVGEEQTRTVGGTTYTLKANASGYVVVKPPLPKSTISGTVTITCTRNNAPISSNISNAVIGTWFGGTQNNRGGTRLFLGFGNAKLMWSDVNNPFYFPENNYMFVGDTSQRITAIEKQGDMLVIFKEREMFYTTYVQGEIDAEAVQNGTNVDVTVSQAYFPLTQLSPQIGCRCPQSIVLCRDRLVWLDADARIYTLVTTGMYSERNVREIGQKIRPYLLEHTTDVQRKYAAAVDHNNKYRLLVGNYMVEFDYNDSGFVNVSGYASEERAARNVAWFVHHLQGLPQTGDRVLAVSDGADRAVWICSVTIPIYPSDGLKRFVSDVYVFDEGAKDRYRIYEEVLTNSSLSPTGSIIEQPIVSTLTTKTYELSDPAAFKRIRAFFPMMRTDGAVIRFIPDGECPVSGRWYQSEDLRAHLVVPSVKRCQTLAIRIDAEGALCIKGLRLQYTPFGTVR